MKIFTVVLVMLARARYIYGKIEKTRFSLNKKGDKEWRRGKLFHRTRGRFAIEYKDGSGGEIWTNGERCNTVKITEEGTFYSYKGKFHRSEGPAVIMNNGILEYWMYGERHRGGGLPAVVNRSGTIQEYWVNNRRHRSGGLPAVIHWNSMEYWEHGELHRTEGPALITPQSTQYWIRGKCHREGDLPAVIYNEGAQHQYYGRIRAQGEVEYWYNGKLHRDNGLPAVIWQDHSEYWVYGLMHRRGDLPALESSNHIEYRINGQLHRDNGLPAVMSRIHTLDWSYMYYVYGKLHREDGPATTSFGEYYLNDYNYTEEEFNAIMKLRQVKRRIKIRKTYIILKELHICRDIQHLITQYI